jgi:hypothetical protein
MEKRGASVQPAAEVVRPRAMRFIWGIAIAAVVLSLGACGDRTEGGSGDGPAGSVHGDIQMTGGPRGAPPVGAAGTVVVTRKGHEVGKQDVPDGGQFRFSLPAGSYRLSVKGAGGACVATDVTVSAGGDQGVTLICQRK